MIVEALFAAVFARVLVAYLRRRDPLQRDAAVMFSALGRPRVGTSRTAHPRATSQIPPCRPYALPVSLLARASSGHGGAGGTDQREIELEERSTEGDRRDLYADQRDAQAADRERHLERRQRAADDRAQRADVRDSGADERDVIADERDRLADMRDRAAYQREIDAELRDGSNTTGKLLVGHAVAQRRTIVPPAAGSQHGPPAPRSAR